MRSAQTILLLMMLALGFNCVAVDTPAANYSLSVASVFEPTPVAKEWVFILGGTGSTRGGETVCKSVASLKRLLEGLPRGSTLEWFPTCSGESEVLSRHLEDLKAVCTKAGIRLIIHPAG